MCAAAEWLVKRMRCVSASRALSWSSTRSCAGKLKAEGMVTRDPRAKERKKYGQKGASKRFQFSKR